MHKLLKDVEDIDDSGPERLQAANEVRKQFVVLRSQSADAVPDYYLMRNFAVHAHEKLMDLETSFHQQAQELTQLMTQANALKASK